MRSGFSSCYFHMAFLSPPPSLLPITPSSNPKPFLPSRFRFNPFLTPAPRSRTLSRAFHCRPASVCSCLPMPPLEASTPTSQVLTVFLLSHELRVVFSLWFLQLFENQTVGLIEHTVIFFNFDGNIVLGLFIPGD